MSLHVFVCVCVSVSHFLTVCVCVRVCVYMQLCMYYDCVSAEPDVGMPQAEAQKYFRQLIDGLVSPLLCFIFISDWINYSPPAGGGGLHKAQPVLLT